MFSFSPDRSGNPFGLVPIAIGKPKKLQRRAGPNFLKTTNLLLQKKQYISANLTPTKKVQELNPAPFDFRLSSLRLFYLE